MNTTPNINLSTYTSDPNDKFNLLVTFNDNMSKIDTAVGAQNDEIDVIEQTAITAVSTANTASTTATSASTTATQALDVANSKPSINDTVASATSTYSSEKIEELISGIQPGSEIDDSVTSLTKTWSSSKINTEISSKASINDNTPGNTTTYSSNKINDLLDDIDPIPYTGDSDNTVSYHQATVTDYSTSPSVKKLPTDSISITTPGYYYLSVETTNDVNQDRNYCFSILTCKKGNRTIFSNMKDQPKRNYFQTSSAGFGSPLTSNIYYIPANTNIEFTIYSDYFTSNSYQVQLHKIN